MRFDALLFDCGGVIVSPAYHDWMLPPEAADILGSDFIPAFHDSFKRAKKTAAALLPDCLRMTGDQEEYRQLLLYYRQVFSAMAYPASDQAVEALSRAQAFGDERYDFFDDVKPYFEKWRGFYRMGFISDAPPSLRRILDRKGYLSFAQACSVSCEVGHTKPHPVMYVTALRQLGLPAEKALYVDDLPGNLEGARKLGITPVQMRRRMPDGFDPAPLWDGYVVHSFRELDELLEKM